MDDYTRLILIAKAAGINELFLSNILVGEMGSHIRYPILIDNGYPIFSNLPDEPMDFGRVFSRCTPVQNKEHQKEIPVNNRFQ